MLPGRQTEGTGVAIGARERLLQLLCADVGQIGEFTLSRSKKNTNASAPNGSTV